MGIVPLIVKRGPVLGPERDKASAQAFYDPMFNQCRPREAIERYVGDVYIQHNPHVGDGKEAFIDYFERMKTEYPGKKVHFRSSPENRRTTTVCSRRERAEPPWGAIPNSCLHRTCTALCEAVPSPVSRRRK
ncbi:MAG: hypothetical protein DHS20C21_14730 [Gemmatimonadota bacterium]|nr:MAG: hypothetical protein DHS20C21_14730 [Gemmatimonadota bacterium]